MLRNALVFVAGVVVAIGIGGGAIYLQPFQLGLGRIAALSPGAAAGTGLQVQPTATVAAPTPASTIASSVSSAPSPTAPPPTPAPTQAAATATAVSASRGGQLLASEDVIVGIYERISPAIVNITNRRGQQAAGGEFPRSGAGSGVIFDPRGYILTNNHVVDDATRLEVTLADGTNLAATLLGRDPGNDLAVVKIEPPRQQLHVAPLGDSDSLRPGQIAIAIGNPFGLERSITVGIISSVNRNRSGGQSGRQIRNMIQTDAPINPGNSGGPLLNSRGEVVGIATAIESPVRGSVGIGFAVPINTAKQFLPEMLAGKKVAHPWLGISGSALTPATAEELGVSATEGVYVASVVPDGPAAKAGLRGATAGGPRGGDVILSIDGRPLTKTDDITVYLDTKRVGDTVKLEILREGRRQTLEVTLAEWPDNLRRAAP